MAVYTIQDTTLTAIADAVRGKTKETGMIVANKPDRDHSFVKDTQYKLTLTFTSGNVMEEGGISIALKNVETETRQSIQGFRIYEDGEVVEFDFVASFSGVGTLSLGIRSYLTKTFANYSITSGEKYYTPAEMVDEINKLIIIPPYKKVLTGNISNGLRASSFNWFWNDGSVSTKDLTEANSCFNSQFYISDIPIVFNFKEGVNADISSMFYFCNALKELPEINNVRPGNIQRIFCYCENLRSIPEDYMDTWDMEYTHTYQYVQLNAMFQSCHRLRTIPTKILSKLWGPQSEYYGLYYWGFYDCYSLDELVGMEIGTGNFTSNAFGYCLNDNYHLKDFIFATNEDGSAKTANWKSQTISFVNGTIGYGNLLPWGFTEDTRITDDESYQLLKDNPDAWTSLVEYSRYNHDSAVRTINSLPDTSAYGTNIIKFKGESGSATDGGAINTLTEEEIAVATAKGWTVSLV